MPQVEQQANRKQKAPIVYHTNVVPLQRNHQKMSVIGSWTSEKHVTAINQTCFSCFCGGEGARMRSGHLNPGKNLV